MRMAAHEFGNLQLVLWLLDERDADVKATTSGRRTALHYAFTADIVGVLLKHGADPTLLDENGSSPLWEQAPYGTVATMALLPQDPRVRAIVNTQRDGITALHLASVRPRERLAVSFVLLFLRAGANPALADTKKAATPFDWLRRTFPSLHTTISLLEESMAYAEKTSLLIKARRLVTLATSTRVTPSYLRGRVARDQPLPYVTLVPVVSGRNDEDEESRKLCTMLAFLLGMGAGAEGKAMPGGVFVVVMGMLMPSWDPPRGSTGTELMQRDVAAAVLEGMQIIPTRPRRRCGSGWRPTLGG